MTCRRGPVAGSGGGVRKIATTACYPAGMIGLVFFLAVMLVLPAGATVRLLRQSRRNAGAHRVSARGRGKSPSGPLTARNILLTAGPQSSDQPFEFPRAYRLAGPGPASTGTAAEQAYAGGPAAPGKFPEEGAAFPQPCRGFPQQRPAKFPQETRMTRSGKPILGSDQYVGSSAGQVSDGKNRRFSLRAGNFRKIGRRP